MIIYRKKDSPSDTILEDMRRVTREVHETIAMLKGSKDEAKIEDRKNRVEVVQSPRTPAA